MNARVSLRALATLTIVMSAAAATASAQTVLPQAPPDWELKMSWILRLEDQRILRDPAPAPTPVPVVAKTPARNASDRPAAVPIAPPSPDLVKLLADGEGRVRRRAALAIGRVGLAEGIAPLAKTMAGDTEPEVRQMAAFALGLIGQRAAVEALKAAINDPSALVQGRAAEALGLIGDTASAPVISAMASKRLAAGNAATLDADDLAYPQSADVEAFRLGIYALVRLKAFDALAAVVLDQAGMPRLRWWPVAYALSRIEDKRAAPALNSLLGGSGSITRAFAARGLQSLKDPGAAAALSLRAQAWKEDPRTAVAAIRALAQLGSGAAAPVLRGLLQAPGIDPTLRLETVAAIGTARAAGTLDLLVDLTGDPWPSMRAAAFRAIRDIDPDTFLMVLSGIDADSHWSVRAAIAEMLSTLEPARAVPRLNSMLTDNDARALPAVITALAKLRPADIGATLTRFLAHDDVLVRAAAATAIGDLKLQGGEAALAGAYRAADRDGMYQARSAALAALAKFGAGPALPVLKQALSDPDWAVRVRASALMRELDPSIDVSAAIRPASGRTADSYAAPSLVAPVVSPHVFLETDKGSIEIELAVLDAPQACANFLALARSGYFSGVAIHRVVANFVVQDGDNRGDGEGSPGYTIRDEINQRPYLRGTVGMALDWQDTGGSQFFITHSPQPHLDGRYTVFGYVVSGMDVVDRLRQWDVIRRVRTWDGIEMTVK